MTVDWPMPSPAICGLTIAAGLFLAWGWLGMLQAIAGQLWPVRDEVPDAHRRGRGLAIGLGLLLYGEAYGWAARIDGLDPSAAFGAFIGALGISAGALIVLGFVAAVLTTWALALLALVEPPGRPLARPRGWCIAIRHFATGLLPCGFTLGLVAAGLVMMRYAAAYAP